MNVKWFQGCGLSVAHAAQKYINSAHDFLGLDVPDNLPDIIVGLAALAPMHAYDIQDDAKRLALSMTRVNFSPTEVTGLPGTIYRLPILRAMRQFAFRRLFHSDPVNSVAEFMRYMTQATCTGCRPLYDTEEHYLFQGIHRCLRPWKDIVQEYKKHARELLEPYQCHDRVFRDAVDVLVYNQ